MKNIKTFLTASIVGAAVSLNTYAQQVQGFVHQQSEASGYVWPTDEQVLDKLDKWQDQKFGVLFHWGLYSVPGIVESWSICSEDEEWIPRDTTMTYDAYKQWYWGLKDKFNPVNFNPAQWAEVMKDAGMKYMIFTSKPPATQTFPLLTEPSRTTRKKMWHAMYSMLSVRKVS